MSDQKLRVVCYCRVATKDQLTDDAALNMQDARLREYARQHGMEVVGKVCAYEKGVTMDRQGWQNVLRLADDTKADAVAAVALSRVARGTNALTRALMDLDEHGLALRTCDETTFPGQLSRFNAGSLHE